MKALTKRILPLLLTATMIFSLCSCELLPDPSKKTSASVTIDDLMQKQENRNGASQSIAEISSIIGVPRAVSGHLLMTVEESEDGAVCHIFNLDLAKKLISVPDTQSIGFVSSFLQNGKNAEGIYYLINENVMYVYNCDGTQALASYYSEDGYYPFADSLNGFSFNGIEYYVRDGFVVYEGDNPLESDYFNASVEYLGRHYYLKEEEAVFVFDSLGQPVYEFHRPSYAEDCRIFVLGNGNVFIQYTYETIEGEDYDYIRNAIRHKVVSIFANLERGTVTNPAIEYLVGKMENAFTDGDFDERYTDRVDNVALILDFKNSRIDENEPGRYIILSDSLIELVAMQDVVSGALDILRISYDRNLVKTASGSLLVAGDCTVIGQLNNYRCITERYIVTSGKIYDHDLTPLIDLAEGGYTYYTDVGDNIILSKAENGVLGLYLFKGGEPSFICEYADFTACYEGYAVKEGEVYRYYDENGGRIASTVSRIEWIEYLVTVDGRVSRIGYAVGNTGDVTYYRLSYNAVDIIQ